MALAPEILRFAQDDNGLLLPPEVLKTAELSACKAARVTIGLLLRMRVRVRAEFSTRRIIPHEFWRRRTSCCDRADMGRSSAAPVQCGDARPTQARGGAPRPRG